MKKRLMRLSPWIIILSLLFSSSSSAFDLANAPVSFEDFKIDLFDENSQVTGAIIFDLDVMNNDQKAALNDYVRENGILKLENLVKKDIFGMSDDDIQHRKKIVLTERTDQTEDFSQSEFSEIAYAADGRFSKTATNYKIVTVENPSAGSLTFTCEFYAVLTVEFTKSNNKITAVNQTNFNTLNLPSQYGCENIRIPTYVAADGSSCGATVNYDIYRWLDIDLPHDGITIPIPVKFVKNCVDNVIAYSADY